MAVAASKPAKRPLQLVQLRGCLRASNPDFLKVVEAHAWVSLASMLLLVACGERRSDWLAVFRSKYGFVFDTAFWAVLLGTEEAAEIIRRACVDSGFVPETASVADAFALFQGDRAPALVYATSVLDFARFLPIVVGETEAPPAVLRDWVAAGKHRARMDAEGQAWLEAWLAAHLVA